MTEDTKKQATVLIIDDEVDICYLLKGIMRQKNIEATYVTSLAAAEIMLKEADPALIFLDNHLSDGRGLDYIRRIKETHPTTNIVMITAHDTPHDRETAYREGVDHFIGKPFSREIIFRTLEKMNIGQMESL